MDKGDIKRGEKYTLRFKDRHGRRVYPGARFVDGVTTHPVDARTARRMMTAYGRKLSIELYSPTTTEPPPVISKVQAEEPVQPGDFDEQDETPVKAEFIADDDDELDGLEAWELRAIATEMGLQVHWKAGPEKLRRAIRDARDRS